MTTRGISILLLLWLGITGCGKYGPPVRVHRTPEPATHEPESSPTAPEAGAPADSDDEKEQQP
jgi:hypothetical protein